ncbi:unnamed protein product [Clonostachys byssicola]|uniref:Uncharacterized protein n=1 Tax=Clonostachys byssicola TaxID=160290 RepID=A0A9N9UJK1_9HYPO|nr:unnamed protein product [Clonostachys byssicola]
MMTIASPVTETTNTTKDEAIKVYTIAALKFQGKRPLRAARWQSTLSLPALCVENPATAQPKMVYYLGSVELYKGEANLPHLTKNLLHQWVNCGKSRADMVPEAM